MGQLTAASLPKTRVRVIDLAPVISVGGSSTSTPEPLWGKATSSGELASITCIGGDPVNYVDPSGHTMNAVRPPMFHLDIGLEYQGGYDSFMDAGGSFPVNYTQLANGGFGNWSITGSSTDLYGSPLSLIVGIVSMTETGPAQLASLDEAQIKALNCGADAACQAAARDSSMADTVEIVATQDRVIIQNLSGLRPCGARLCLTPGADPYTAMLGIMPVGGVVGGAGRGLGALARAGAAVGGAAMVRLGQAGEAAVRRVADIGSKIRIPISPSAYRIPDGLTNTTLTEVKNVGSLSYTQQLCDFAAWAGQNGLRFDLWVRPGAQLSGPLLEAQEAGQVIIQDIPFP